MTGAVNVTPARPYVGYLVLGDKPHLIANECDGCGALYLDRRNACSRCFGVSFSTRPLASEGVVKTFTIVHRSRPGVSVPFTSIVVELDGGGTVKANLTGVDPDPDLVSAVDRVELTTASVKTLQDGTDLTGFSFQPTSEPSG